MPNADPLHTRRQSVGDADSWHNVVHGSNGRPTCTRVANYPDGVTDRSADIDGIAAGDAVAVSTAPTLCHQLSFWSQDLLAGWFVARILIVAPTPVSGAASN